MGVFMSYQKIGSTEWSLLVVYRAGVAHSSHYIPSFWHVSMPHQFRSVVVLSPWDFASLLHLSTSFAGMKPSFAHLELLTRTIASDSKYSLLLVASTILTLVVEFSSGKNISSVRHLAKKCITRQNITVQSRNFDRPIHDLKMFSVLVNLSKNGERHRLF